MPQHTPAERKKRDLSLRRAGRAAVKGKMTTFADRRDQERKLGLKRGKKKR